MLNPDIDIDIDAIQQGMRNPVCACYQGKVEPADLIVTHCAGRFIAYIFDDAGRMFMIDTAQMETETEEIQ